MCRRACEANPSAISTSRHVQISLAEGEMDPTQPDEKSRYARIFFGIHYQPYRKTDTGRQVEKTKVNGLILVKELGKTATVTLE